MAEKLLTKNLHVLFVDDDSDEAYLFNEAIEQLGFPVEISKAQDGNDLMRVLSSGKEPLPDLLFLDLNMPHKDGVETLKEIRANDTFNELPVIIFSTSDNKSHTEACYQYGANLYIVKPETFDQILEMVKQIFAIDWSNTLGSPLKDQFVLNFSKF